MGVDLHMHTHHSDGTWSPADLVAYAVHQRLQHIAITDHDTTAGITEAQVAAGTSVNIVEGVEINSIYRNPDGTAKDVHILGYFIDTSNRELQGLLQKQREERYAHAQRLVAKLHAAGFNITMNHVEEFAGKGAVGKMHLAQAIIAAKAAKDATEAYNKYLTRGTDYYEERNSVSPHEAIRAIIAAGGIASIAHPGKEVEAFPLIMELREVGLRAIEAHHRIHSMHTTKHYVQLAERHEMLITGGSDCHGPFEEYEPMLGTVTLPIADFLKLRTGNVN